MLSLEPRKLEVGSGYHPQPGFEHLDINPNCPQLNWIGSGDDLSQFDEETFDELRACDVLEHFSYRHTLDVLKEWNRVLRTGGKIYIQTPNAKLLAKRWLENDLPIMQINGLTMPIDFSASYWICGGQEDGTFAKSGDDWRWNSHYVLFSPESMEFYLKNSGFSRWTIESDGGSNMVIWAWK